MYLFIYLFIYNNTFPVRGILEKDFCCVTQNTVIYNVENNELWTLQNAKCQIYILA
jgi:hypothetical protein